MTNREIGNAIVIGAAAVGTLLVVSAYKGNILRGVKAGARMRVKGADLSDLDRKALKKAKRLIDKYERKIAKARSKAAVFKLKDAFDKAIEQL